VKKCNRKYRTAVQRNMDWYEKTHKFSRWTITANVLEHIPIQRLSLIQEDLDLFQEDFTPFEKIWLLLRRLEFFWGGHKKSIFVDKIGEFLWTLLVNSRGQNLFWVEFSWPFFYECWHFWWIFVDTFLILRVKLLSSINLTQT
jgi:hypothetical protein